MDQGLAAVVGAIVGAIATGGGSLITGLSSSRLQNRQNRREAYRKFIEAGHTADEVKSRVAQSRREIRLEDMELLDDSIAAMRSLLPHVHLAGPDVVMSLAQDVVILAHRISLVGKCIQLQQFEEADAELVGYADRPGTEGDRLSRYSRLGDAYHVALFSFVRKSRVYC